MQPKWQYEFQLIAYDDLASVTLNRQSEGWEIASGTFAGGYFMNRAEAAPRTVETFRVLIIWRRAGY